MNRTRDRVKSLILFILFITSLIQVGILWSYQNHGLPISFLSSFFANSETSSPDDISHFIAPYRIIVSEGYDGSHWPIYSSREEYNKLWDEARVYLVDIMGQDNLSEKSEPFSDELWGKLVTTGRTFIFEFKVNIRMEILSLLNKERINLPGEPAGVSKLIISPWSDINNNMTIYIADNESSRIYTYSIPIRQGGLSREDYDSMFKKFKQDSSLISYNIFEESNFKKRDDLSISNDALIIMSDKYKYSSLSRVRCTWPDDFRIRRSISDSELDRLATKILGSEKDSYVPSEDTNYRSYMFKNINNTYRVYEDGLLEYKRSTVLGDSEKGSMRDAFKNAVDFISKRKDLLAGLKLYLSGIKDDKSKSRYEFTFNYIIGDTPLLFSNYEYKRKDPKLLNNAITVEANGNGVYSCWWIIKNFEPVKGNISYNVGFNDFMDLLSKSFKEREIYKDNKIVNIRDIMISYKVDSADDNQSMEPLWVITTAENGTITMKLNTK